MILHYDHYRAGSRARRLKTLVVPLLSGVAILLIALLFILGIPGRLFPVSRSRPSTGRLSELWKAERYEEVVSTADAVLKGDPLNAVALAYRGFAYFYRAVSENAMEERMPFLDEAVVSLRRARLAGAPFAGEIDYVLGKSYFYRGKYYYDLAISRLESSLARGYTQKDTREYIGLAYTQLEEYEKGLQQFLTALQEDSSDLLLLTIAKTYYQMKRTGEAVDYYLRALNKTEDKSVEKEARSRLGQIYLDGGELFKAEEQFLAIVNLDPQSAEAHFNLGEVYFKMNADIAKARDEWRKALIIDPSHTGALLRYYPKKR